MQTKTLKTLGFVTILVAVAAGVVSTMKGGGTSEAAENESGPLFPELRERVNDVAVVKVANKDGAFEVARKDGRWGMPKKGDYPVDFSKVKEVVLAVSKLEKVEKKTKNPELYSRLGVEDVSAVDAQSTKVVLADGDGNELAAVLVGNTHQRSAGAGDPNIYVRKVGEDQAWQCEGRVWVEPTEGNWLQKEIVSLGQERIQSATTTHPDGETLRVAKTTQEDTNWAVEGLPEGRELSWDGAANTIARAVQRLMLQDVRPADEAEFDESQSTVTEFATFDGLVLTVKVVETGENSLMKLSAAVDPSLRADQAPGPPVAEEPDDANAGEEGADEEPESTLKSLEDVEAEARELNERFAEWVYVVPSYTASNLRKRVDELLKPLATESPEGAGAAGAGLEQPQTLEDMFPDGLPPEIQQAIDQAEAADEGGLSDSTEGTQDPEGEEPAPTGGEDGR